MLNEYKTTITLTGLGLLILVAGFVMRNAL